MLTRPVKCALRLDEALHEHRSLLHCLLPVLHTLPQLFQYTVVVSLERMNRFEEEVDICIIRPQAYGVKHARCLDYAPAIVLLSERPVVIACSIRLLQVYYWRVRPRLSKPGKIIITCRACMQGTWMPKIEAKNQWYTALKCKISNLLRLLDTVVPLSRYSHILKQEKLQSSLGCITRKGCQTLSHLGNKCLLMRLICHISHAHCSQVTSRTQRAEPCSKIDRSFVPAHSRISHRPVRVQ